MALILAMVNQKGGVGKTTTAVNLTAALTALGKKVLLCDFDPQANATSGLGAPKGKGVTSYDLVINGASAADAVVHTDFGDLIPSSPALSGAGVELVGSEGREFALARALEPIRDQYDLIFIDCPPSLELLTLNALCAADGIFVPVQCEYTNFSAQVAEEVRRHFPGQVYATVIPRNVRLSEAPSHGLPVRAYDKYSRGAAAYEALAAEIIEKEVL